LGNLLAAQLWQTVQTAIPDLSEHIASGRMAPLLEWLRSNIHARGRREYTQALAMRVTGKELSTAPLVRYLQDRYLPLYRLNS
jgi:carboxypeptidase Taq